VYGATNTAEGTCSIGRLTGYLFGDLYNNVRVKINTSNIFLFSETESSTKALQEGVQNHINTIYNKLFSIYQLSTDQIPKIEPDTPPNMQLGGYLHLHPGMYNPKRPGATNRQLLFGCSNRDEPEKNDEPENNLDEEKDKSTSFVPQQ
jgi:hypothetical protein